MSFFIQKFLCLVSQSLFYITNKKAILVTNLVDFLETGWRAEFVPPNHPVSQYEFDVIIGADGKRNTLQGFKRKEFRGKLAIGVYFVLLYDKKSNYIKIVDTYIKFYQINLEYV